MKSKSVEYLERNRLLHIAMLEAIRRGTAKILSASDAGVLLLDQSSRVHMLSAADIADGIALLDSMKSIGEKNLMIAKTISCTLQKELLLHDNT